MAYLARIEAAPTALQVPVPADIEWIVPEPQPEFSDLEWSIIRLAKVHGLWTIRRPTRLSRLFNRLLARNPNPTLANPKLEALRRIAVLSWHFGFSVDGLDVAEFLEAGFTLDQYELLVLSIRRAGSNVVSLGQAGRA